MAASMAPRRLRLRICTWNVAGSNPDDAVDLNDFLFGVDAEDLDADVVFVVLQEVDVRIDRLLWSQFADDPWILHLESHLSGRDFVRVSATRMFGIVAAVFLRRRHLLFARRFRRAFTRVGFGGLIGNKGGISTRMSLYGKEVCLLGVHLSAHIFNVEERMKDLASFFYEQTFDVVHPRIARRSLEVLDHDLVVLAGDLNFRIDGLDRESIVEAVALDRLDGLLSRDQLLTTMRIDPAMEGWREAEIRFGPTYKFDVGTDDFDSSEKMRKPAWCDRVLWWERKSGSEEEEEEREEEACHDFTVDSINYASHPSFLSSDHKPVSLTLILSLPESPSLLPLVRFILSSSTWSTSSDAIVEFVVAADAVVDSWDWIGVFGAGFSNLGEYVAWNYASSGRAVDVEEEEEGAKRKELTFASKYLSAAEGERVLVYVSGGDVFGVSSVFRINK